MRTCVIGAGLAGLTAARHAHAAGFEVTVLDKGRGLGGRMATRRTADGFVFDHGAQYFTVRTPDFKALVTEAIKDRALALWAPADEAHRPPTTGSNDPWYVGCPGMSGLAKWLARSLDVRTGTTVTGLTRASGRWHVETTDDGWSDDFDRIVVAIPAPQAQTLLSGIVDINARLSAVSVDPCWAVLAGFEQPLKKLPAVYRSETTPIGRVARNGTKMGRPPEHEAVVVHMNPEWSTAYLEHTPEDVSAMALIFLGKMWPELPGPPSYLSAHRWRYARTRVPLGAPFISSADGSLLVGGDWCLGARVECAYESGAAIGKALASRA